MYFIFSLIEVLKHYISATNKLCLISYHLTLIVNRSCVLTLKIFILWLGISRCVLKKNPQSPQAVTVHIIFLYSNVKSIYILSKQNNLPNITDIRQRVNQLCDLHRLKFADIGIHMFRWNKPYKFFTNTSYLVVFFT